MLVEEKFGVRVPEGDEARPIFRSVSTLAEFIGSERDAKAERRSDRGDAVIVVTGLGAVTALGATARETWDRVVRGERAFSRVYALLRRTVSRRASSPRSPASRTRRARRRLADERARAPGGARGDRATRGSTFGVRVASGSSSAERPPGCSRPSRILATLLEPGGRASTRRCATRRSRGCSAIRSARRPIGSRASSVRSCACDRSRARARAARTRCSSARRGSSSGSSTPCSAARPTRSAASRSAASTRSARSIPTGARPFDARRRGLTLGEGAGFVVLERAEDAGARGKDAVCTLLGWVTSYCSLDRKRNDYLGWWQSGRV